MAEATNQAVIQQLERLLATSYTLYLKTHNFHWNVTGPMFTTLHTLFETQYTELAIAIDEIAERIRALGARAPGRDFHVASIQKLGNWPQLFNNVAHESAFHQNARSR